MDTKVLNLKGATKLSPPYLMQTFGPKCGHAPEGHHPQMTKSMMRVIQY